MSSFNTLLKNIQLIPLKFVDEEFKIKINFVINDFFPSLNSDDINVLIILTTFLIDVIAHKYHFEKNSSYYNQLTQNNAKDMKGIILLLLPFIDDKNDAILLKKLNDLNHLLYAKDERSITRDILNLERDRILSTHFTYGNMGITLLNPIIDESNDTVLNLYIDETKLIYEVMHHNLISLLRTLEMTNGKTYINWINIVPLNLEDYIDSKLFSNTILKLNELNNVLPDVPSSNLLLTRNLYDYAGLWFGDFYNVLRVKYYEEIKKIKWLIFPYEFNDKKIYLINGLNELFNVDSIINSIYENFDDMDDTNRSIFSNQVSHIHKKLSNNISTLGNIVIDYEIIKFVIIYLINDNIYSKFFIEDIFNKFKLEQVENTLDITEEKDDDFDKVNTLKILQITNNDIKEAFSHIQEKYYGLLWTFIKDTINILSGTSLKKFILINDNGTIKVSNKYYYEPFNTKFKSTSSYIPNKLNLKNIYNIAKTLSHYDKDDWELMDKNYISLSYESRTKFFTKLFDNSSSWINLNRNIKRQFPLSQVNIGAILNDIVRAFSSMFYIIVFEELVSNGLLNKFVISEEITDKSLLPSLFSTRKKLQEKLLESIFNKNKKDWLEAYYYLTNDKFKNMKKIKLERDKGMGNIDKYNEFDYFSLIVEDHGWPHFYAMDWVSQISFFHHYIHNQVMYVTGATGQGKSTQVPKLLLYAMKMIDYKANGRVICTQPRITPVVENSTRISDELGLPLEEPVNKSSFKLRTNNYYIQMKHKQDSHTNNNINYNTLKIVTDGTLLEELKMNIVMKDKINEKYIDKNIYDIIIVDEAHEHNANMDLIIAYSKQTCYFNNQTRIIVVSATMDDDEPIYRRYFSNINDHLLFPIKYTLFKHPFLDINNFLPNVKYIDRRYHISPPGETTQYKVDEFYLDSDLIAYGKDGKENLRETAKLAQNEGYRKIIEICTKYQTGEILFFANGEKEIKMATKYLNEVLPPGNVALPFFSSLNENYKSIITKIDTKISSIRNERTKIHEEWGSVYKEDTRIPTGLYKRAVIIATNVAEASVTIPRLSFVVDNGYAKVNSYEPITNMSILDVEKISESSRLQRKGRVGRIGDGMVYYMYQKDARRFIKPKYQITQEDITSKFLSLLCDKDLQDADIPDIMNYQKTIISELINPNSFLSMLNFNNVTEKNYYTVKSGLFDIMKKNCYIDRKPLREEYYDKYILETIKKYADNKIKILYLLYPREFVVLNTGQTMDNLLDKYGLFYLIHPFENSIKRNVLNEIISVDNKKIRYIEDRNFVYIISYLFNNNFIIDKNAEYLFNNKDEISNPRNFIKTELARKVCEMSKDYEFDKGDIITLISSQAMGCFNQVYELLLFLRTISNSISNLSTLKFPQYLDIYKGKYTSDFMFLLDIIKNLKSSLNDLLVFNLDKKETQVRITHHYESILDKFLKLKKMQKENNNFTPPLDSFDFKLWNKLSNLLITGNMSKFQKIMEGMSIGLDLFKKDIEKNKDRIKKWCENNYISENIIVNFLNLLFVSNINKKLILKHRVLEWADKLYNKFNNVLTTFTLEEKIIKSFMYGKPSNFAYKTKLENEMLSVMNRKVFNVYYNIDFFTKERLTMTNLSNSLIFYYSFSVNDTGKSINVSIVSNIDPKWLTSTYTMLFNPYTFPSYFIDWKGDVKHYFFMGWDNYERIKKEILNNWNQDKNPWTLDDIETPIMTYFYKMITKTMTRSSKY